MLQAIPMILKNVDLLLFGMNVKDAELRNNLRNSKPLYQ